MRPRTEHDVTKMLNTIVPGRTKTETFVIWRQILTFVFLAANTLKPARGNRLPCDGRRVARGLVFDFAEGQGRSAEETY